MLVGSLIGGIAVALAVWLSIQEEVDELLDDTLRASAEVLGALVPADAKPTVVAVTAADTRFAWQVVDRTQQVAMRSERAPSTPLLATAAAGFHDTPAWRVFGLALGAEGRMLYVAQTRAERAEAQFEVALSAVLAALGIGVLMIFWLRALVRHEMAPVQRLSDRLSRHEPLRSGATLGPAERSEFEPVHRAIDDLGQRLARRMAHERAFTAHAAHALRTPLAGIDAQLAMCLRESPDALRPRLQRAREATGRLQRVLVALLALFRSDADPVREPVGLQSLMEQVPLASVQLDLQAHQPVHADADLLAAALVNLLDNSQRHGATRVQLSTPAPDTLRLHDNGPGVDEARRQALGSALAAQDYDAVPGLGLTLADLVARAHGGTLSLPRVAQGFAVELTLRPA